MSRTWFLHPTHLAPNLFHFGGTTHDTYIMSSRLQHRCPRTNAETEISMQHIFRERSGIQHLREGRKRNLAREKLGCNAVSMDISANPLGSFEDGLSQTLSQLGDRAGSHFSSSVAHWTQLPREEGVTLVRLLCSAEPTYGRAAQGCQTVCPQRGSLGPSQLSKQNKFFGVHLFIWEIFVA